MVVGGWGLGVIINQHKENKVEGPAHSKLAREEISISEKKEKKNPFNYAGELLGLRSKNYSLKLQATKEQQGVARSR